MHKKSDPAPDTVIAAFFFLRFGTIAQVVDLYGIVRLPLFVAKR
jgi:hypothetical protein